jgi:hypothetical protein
MNQDSIIDKMIKIPLLTDVINLIGMRPYKRFRPDDPKRIKTLWEVTPKGHLSTTPPYEALEKLNDRNFSTILDADHILTLFETEEENYRRGNFVRVWPDSSKPDDFLNMIEKKKFSNYLVRKYLKLRDSGTDILEIINKNIGIKP